MSRRSNNAAGFFNLGGYKEGCADGVVSGWDSAMARADRLVEIGEELGRLEERYAEADSRGASINNDIKRCKKEGYTEFPTLLVYSKKYHRRCLSIVSKAERLVDEVIRIKRGE